VVGLPAVVTVKVNFVPVVSVADAALVKVGTVTLVPAAFTVKVIVWTELPAVFAAVMATE
jgi:hypothetical protein